MTKKRNKQNNNNERYIKFARALLSQTQTCVCCIEGQEFSTLHSMRDGTQMRATPEISDALFDIAHPWSVFIGVFCHDEAKGVVYVESVEMSVSARYKADKLGDVLTEEIKRVTESCNLSHVLGYGWIANPSGREMNEETAFKIFNSRGVFPA